jgi:hypothetical protein
MNEKLLFPDAPLRKEDIIKPKRSRKELKLARDSRGEAEKQKKEEEERIEKRKEIAKSGEINRPEIRERRKRYGL